MMIKTLIKLAKCAELALNDDPMDIYSRLTEMGFDDVKHISCARTSTNLFVASNRTEIIIAFKASKERHDWLITNINAVFCPEFLYPLGKVHRGFAYAYHSIKDELKAYLADQSSDKIITVCGHSLGGALAMLAAGDIENIDYCVTFGAPRVFSRKAAANYRKLPIADRTTRVVVLSDFVTRIPRAWWGYKHEGHEINFDNDGVLLKCPTWWNKTKVIIEDFATEITNGELFKFEDHSIHDRYIKYLKRLEP